MSNVFVLGSDYDRVSSSGYAGELSFHRLLCSPVGSQRVTTDEMAVYGNKSEVVFVVCIRRYARRESVVMLHELDDQSLITIRQYDLQT